jgi:hypothetical protein
MIYTTNIIESYHRQLRKVTKGKSIFPTDVSLLKMLYLATMDVTRKWTGHVQNWGQMLLQLSVFSRTVSGSISENFSPLREEPIKRVYTKDLTDITGLADVFPFSTLDYFVKYWFWFRATLLPLTLFL